MRNATCSRNASTVVRTPHTHFNLFLADAIEQIIACVCGRMTDACLFIDVCMHACVAIPGNAHTHSPLFLCVAIKRSCMYVYICLCACVCLYGCPCLELCSNSNIACECGCAFGQVHAWIRVCALRTCMIACAIYRIHGHQCYWSNSHIVHMI